MRLQMDFFMGIYTDYRILEKLNLHGFVFYYCLCIGIVFGLFVDSIRF